MSLGKNRTETVSDACCVLKGTVKAEEAPAQEEAPVVAPAEGKLVLFTRVTCPNCRIAENLLGKAGISYEKLIAEENVDLCRKFDIKGAPTLVAVNGEHATKFYGVPEIKKFLANF